MLVLPWKAFGKAEQGRKYTVLLCEFPLKSYAAIPRFLRFAWRVARHLKGARGLVGYSLLVRPFRKEFCTLSVWQSEKTLMNNFVRREPLSYVMGGLQPEVGPPRLIRWTIQGEACPPRWDEAFVRATSRPRGEILEQPDSQHQLPFNPLLPTP